MSDRRITRRARSRRRQANLPEKRIAAAVVETLERRQLLNAAIVVNTTADTVADDGVTSLREAVALAESQAGDDTITFDSTAFDSGSLHTISLAPEPIDITGVNGALTITGPGVGVLEINATGSGRSFDVESGATATITDMAMRGGSALGAGVRNLGNLTLTSVNIHNNGINADPGPDNPSGDGFTGDDAQGAAIYNSGTLFLNTSMIADNGATAGHGGGGVGSGGTGGAAQGAGIYTSGDVTISDCTFTGNIAVGGGGGTSLGVGGDGGAAAGAAIYATTGTNVQIAGGSFDSNSAQGGHSVGGSLVGGGDGGAAFGGAVYCDGDLTINGVSFNSNYVQAGNGGEGSLGNAGNGGAGSGGAVYASGSIGGSFNTFSSNAATGGISGIQANASDNPTNGGEGVGGAIAVAAAATGSLQQTSFSANQANGGQGGSADVAQRGAVGGEAFGGAAYVISGDFTFQTDTFDSNQASGGGGGVGGSAGESGTALGGAAYYGGVGTLSFLGGSITNNIAQGANDSGPIGDTGGDGQGGGVAADGKLALFEITVDSNSALGGNGNASDQSQGGHGGGGGIWSSNDLSIVQCTITNNAATGGDSTNASTGQGTGAGVEIVGGNLTLKLSTIEDNTATGGKDTASSTTHNGASASGGGIFDEAASSNITTSLIDHNIAQGGGGADVTSGNGTNGGAGFGAGVYAPIASTKITDSTMYANNANGGDGGTTTSSGNGGNAGQAGGAGVFASAAITLLNDTITANVASAGSVGTSSGGGSAGNASPSQGGGVFSTAGLTLTNTIVANNSADSDVDVQGTIDASHDLIKDTSGITFNTNTANLTGIDPQLGALADNGGLTHTLKPLDGSPVFNKGDDAAALAEFGANGTDQRGVGFPRFLGTVDIGAVESGIAMIGVSGNGNAIVNNDTTPSTSDFTDFGTTDRAAAATLQRTFTVTNTGQLPLSISSVQVPAGYSIVEPLSSSIGAGLSDTFTVALFDQTAGTFAGNIVINSNDPNTPAFTFAVTGTISPTIRINFQPNGSPIPDTFAADTGSIFGSRGNGLSYGWNASASSFARDRNLISNQAEDTFIHTQLYGNRTWEISVPNGAYQVHVVAGDPGYIDSNYMIDAENVLLVNGKPTNGNHFVEGTATVIVSDGKLTLSNAAGAVNNKFDYVDITPVPLPVVKINFETPTSPTPAGYLADSGAVFANRGNGYSYGWNLSATSASRDRNAANSPNQLEDTFIHTELYGTRTWEIALPNGSYSVHLVAGDPDYTDSVYKYNLEGILALSGTPTNANHWISGTITVNVSDGRLTLSNAGGSSNNKIDYIEITPV